MECSFGGADETVEKLKAPKEGRKEGRNALKRGKTTEERRERPLRFLVSWHANTRYVKIPVISPTFYRVKSLGEIVSLFYSPSSI